MYNNKKMQRGISMKKVFKKMSAAIVSGLMCTVPALKINSAIAEETEKKNTYIVCNTAQDSNIAYFDFEFIFSSKVTAEKSIATTLCNSGYFRSNVVGNRIQSTYNGDAIGSKGILTTTKFIAPIDTKSIFDEIEYCAVIRNENNISLSPTAITVKSILLGDANQDGVVDDNDVSAINKYLISSTKFPLSEDGMLAADVNMDGTIDSKDSMSISNYNLGVFNHF